MLRKYMMVMILLLWPITGEAVPPVPAVIAGTVTINGSVLTQAEDDGYTITVIRSDGTAFISASGASALDGDGLSVTDWYWIDIPLYDAVDQPEGAVPGEIGIIQVFYSGEELVVTTPENGQIVIGASGSRTRIDIVATGSGSSVPDPGDSCPDDPAKEEPGICGCGVPDTDTDGDTVPDCNDAFPDDSSKWEEDENNDDQTPHDGETPLETPSLIYPADSQPGVELTPELSVETPVGNTDPEAGHAGTQWQVAYDSDFSSPVLDITSSAFLTSLPVPHLILEENTTYYWRVRFKDNTGQSTSWSDDFWFTTLSSKNDIAPANGVPDSQDVDAGVDLDDNGISDIYQSDMKTVRTVCGNAVVGVKASNNVAAVESLMSLDVSDLSDRWPPPEDFEIGIISFKVAVDHPDEPAVVIIFLSLAAPDNAKWYKFDTAAGWEDYSEHVTFSTDRKSFSLELYDGGPGDADGIKNGVIIDPGGLVFQISREPVQTSHEDADSNEKGGGGCFAGTIFIY